ncbi:MAG TPA: DUF2510 domain-containing protein [Mycobacterium sp.]
MSAPASGPGWYPDPSGIHGRRYFDGNDWTDHRAPSPMYHPLPVPYGFAASQQVSTKSSAVAGLLQLFFGWFGIGRFYVGSGTSIALGAIQLVLGLFGLLTFFFFFVGLIILIPLSIWTFIDAIVLFTGSARDSEGRRLR